MWKLKFNKFRAYDELLNIYLIALIFLLFIFIWQVFSCDSFEKGLFILIWCIRYSPIHVDHFNYFFGCKN